MAPLAILARKSNFDLHLVRLRFQMMRARHVELSAVFSADDAIGAPSARLLDVAPRLIARARNVQLSLLAERNAPPLVHLWPGEHYRLLAALVQELKPREVLEIGTYTGHSALAIASSLPEGCRLTTVDVIPWSRFPGTSLRESDFSNGSLRQLICDFGDVEVCKAHQSVLSSAELIFIDGPKDGVFERRLLKNFATCGPKPGALLVFDDIRVWNMLQIWRDVRYPKLDLTSFGHWSGTGLVDWTGDV